MLISRSLRRFLARHPNHESRLDLGGYARRHEVSLGDAQAHTGLSDSEFLEQNTRRNFVRDDCCPKITEGLQKGSFSFLYSVHGTPRWNVGGKELGLRLESTSFRCQTRRRRTAVSDCALISELLPKPTNGPKLNQRIEERLETCGWNHEGTSHQIITRL